MPSVLIQTADAVVEALNRPTTPWSQNFTAVRSYAEWDLPLDETQCERGFLYCDVVPRSDPGFDSETQSSVEWKPGISVVLRKKFQPKDAEAGTGKLTKSAVDELVTLVEEIAQYFALERLANFDYAAWESTTIEAAVVHKHIREHNQYTGIIRLNFRSSVSV